MGHWAKVSTAVSYVVGPVLDSAGAEYTGAAIGDLSISKNGGTLTALASAATLTHIANGQYTLALTTGNTDTLGTVRILCTKSTYQMPTLELMILPATVYDALTTNATTAAGGLGDIQRMAGTVLTGRDIGTSVLLSSGTGTGQLDLTSGVVKANVTQFGGTNATASGGRPEVNTTHAAGTILATASAGYLPADVRQFGGSAGTFSGGRPEVNTTHIAGTAWASTTLFTLASHDPGATLGTSTLTGAAAADAVWDEAISGHLGAGSTGAALNAAGSAGDPWTTTLPGSYTGSQAGKMLADILTDTAEIGAAGAGLTSLAPASTALSSATWTGTRAGYLDNLSGGAVALASGVTLADGAHGGAAAVLTLERMVVTSTTDGEPAVKLTGKGSGAGLLSQGEAGAGSGAGAKFVGALGSAGHGLHAVGGSTSANGVQATGGHGIAGTGSGTGKAGMYLVGGASAGGLQLQGGSSASGLRSTGGTSGHGVEFTGGTNGHGAQFTANGTGSGVVFTAGASGDDVYLTGSDAPTLLAAVWTGGTRTLTAGTNIVLAKGTGVTGFTDLDAAGVRDAVGLAAANLDTQLGAIDDYLDTEVAAIKAKTDNLPAAPAATGDVPTAVQNADALLGRNVAGGSSTGRTVSQALFALRNKVVISGGTGTVYSTDDTTSSWTFAVTSDAAADPITAVDPA